MDGSMKMSLLTLLLSFFSFSLKAETSLPILRNISSLVIVEIKISDKPYKFLLDTGSNVNFIDPDVVEELKKANALEMDSTLNTDVSTFNQKITSLGAKLSLKINDLSFNQMPTNIMKNKRFNTVQDGLDCCDGILGSPFLKQYPLKYDLIKNAITFSPASTQGFQYQLPFEIRGRDVLVLNCSNSKVSFPLRLDTGSEIPLTFHTHFVKENRFFEKIYEINNMFAPSFLNLKKTICGPLEFSTEAYLYTGQSGALAHREVAGNLGPKVLGDEYIIDYQKKIIWLKNNKQSIDLEGVLGAEVDAFRPTSRADMIQRMEFFVLKSCVEKDQNSEECFKKWCDIRKIEKCPTPKSTDIEELIKAFHFNRLDQTCPLPQLRDMYTNGNDLFSNHPCQWKRYIENRFSTHSRIIQSHVYQAKITSDNITKAIAINNQEEFTQNFYCYGVKEKLFKSEELPLPLFSLSIKGISFSKKAYSDYLKWKKSKPGLVCLQAVKSFFNVDQVSDFPLKSLEKNQYGIVVNELTLLGDGVKNMNPNDAQDMFTKNFTSTLNHERLHTFFASHPKIKKLLKDHIKKLDKKTIEDFKSKHPSYNFSNEEIFLREFFAYSYEQDMSKIFTDFPELKK